MCEASEASKARREIQFAVGGVHSQAMTKIVCERRREAAGEGGNTRRLWQKSVFAAKRVQIRQRSLVSEGGRVGALVGYGGSRFVSTDLD